MQIPDPKHFARIVQEHENKYNWLDRVYLNSLQSFKRVEPGFFGAYEAYSVLCLYLLKWGNMKRVLGYRGCKRLGEKLGQMEPRFNEFQPLTLSTIDLEQMSEKIESIYSELLNAEWESEKGRTKRVGPTATAKVLHLVVPDLFMIWDRKIRDVYGFRDNSREYLRFLFDMQNWLKALGPTVENLQEQYGKSCTKIIDEYNWKTCWG